MKTSQATMALCLCVSLFPRIGAAQAPPVKAETLEIEALTDKARQLFMEGLDALKKGRWAEAHASFLAAWRIKPHYQIASNLGVSEIKLGKHRDAAEHLSYYLREAPKTKEKERQRAQGLFDEARAKVASVTIRGLPDGAELKVDGELIGRAPFDGPVFVGPGSHAFEGRMDGFQVMRASFVASAGEARDLELLLKKDAPPSPPAPIVPARRSLVPGLVLGGGGVVAAAVGIGLLVGGGSKRSTADALAQGVLGDHQSCVDGASNFDARCGDIRDTTLASDRLHNAGVGMLIGAGALATATVIYFAWPAPRVSVMPAVAPSGAALWVSGSF